MKFIFYVELAFCGLWTALVFAQTPIVSMSPTSGSTIGSAQFFSPTPTPTATSAFNFLNAFATATTTPTPTATSFISGIKLFQPSEPTSTPTPEAFFSATPTPTEFIYYGPTPTPTATPINRSGIALLPTAFSNNRYRTSGWNLDLLFTYYIGSILQKNFQPTPNINYLTPLRLWLFTADLKYAWLNDTENHPGIATGYFQTFIVNGSAQGASAASNNSGFQFTTNSIGSIYTVVSKRLGGGSSVGVGIMRGNLAGLFGNSPTFNRILPNRNPSYLLTLLSPSLSSIENEEAPNMFFSEFSISLGKTQLEFELWKPFPMDLSPFLINTRVSRLFSFNLAFEHWIGGYSLLGYFNVRFTIIPSSS